MSISKFRRKFALFWKLGLGFAAFSPCLRPSDNFGLSIGLFIYFFLKISDKLVKL